jgi:hypothetical protein
MIQTVLWEHQKSVLSGSLVLTLSKGLSFRPCNIETTSGTDKWMAYVHDPYPISYPRP